MKKQLILLFFMIALLNIVQAQEVTKKETLLKTSKELLLESRDKFSKAVLAATKNNWPLKYKSGNQNSAKLISVDAKGWPKYYIGFADPVASITINANKVWPGGTSNLNLSGADDVMTNKLGVWDEGSPRLTHKDLINRITQKDNNTEIVTHSTHVAGIVMSKGLNPLGKGMAFNLKGILDYDWNNDLSEMSAAAANGLLISNHSYGTVTGWNYNSDSSRWEFNGRWNEKEDYRFGLYDYDAQIQDSIAYNAPNYLIVAAAGNNRTSAGPAVGQPYWRRNETGRMINAGNRPTDLSSNDSYGSISSDKNAKNVLTVGAVNGIPSSYNKKEDVVMSNFSSWGPTDDGRIKPDIVAQGVAVYAPIATNDSSYGYLNGTSMASPGAAGSLLLLQELSQRFVVNGAPKILKSATVKGLAIHTANEAGLYPGPDYKFGWGLLNIAEAAQVLNTALSNNNSATSPHYVYEHTLLNGESKTYTFTASGTRPVKATLVWTDVKGVSSEVLNDFTPKLINDLDLEITQGNKKFNTWNLDPRTPEDPPFKGVNSIDNVEKVEVDTSLVGTVYTVTVKHKGTLDRGQQNYALMISGAGGTAYCASTATSTAGTKIDSIQLNNIKFSKTAADNYVNNTALFVNGESNGSLTFFVRLSSADATNNNRFVKVFIDYNNNGLFDANELVHTSPALTNGDYSTTINLASNLTINQFTKLRVVAAEAASAADVNACGNYTVGETQDYTLKVVSPSNDVQLMEITNPSGGVFEKAVQYVTVKVANNGTNRITNFPLTLEVKKDNNTILNITETFTGRLYGSEIMLYTFQTPIGIELNQTYSITASVSINNDQQPANNTLTSTIKSANSSTAITGSATGCNDIVQLLVNNPNSEDQYLWYDKTNDLSKPIAMGTIIRTSTSSKNVYVGKGWSGFIGPKDNTTLSNSGGYNNWGSSYGEFIRFNTKGPIVLETTKLYTGYAGKIELELRSLSTFTDSTYSYYPSQTQKMILHVGASSPNPTPATGTGGSGTPTPFVAGDTGRVYAINMNLAQAGNYILIARCLDSATIFRNNNITSTNHPFGPTVLASITGNWAGENFEKFYYFFYNMQLSTPQVDKNLTQIPVILTAKPVITQIGIDSLSTGVAESYQWFMNDEIVNGGNKQGIKITKNALYKVSATTGTCTNYSDNKLVLITDIPQAPTKEIGLKILSTDYVENIIKGNQFYIQFNNVKSNVIGLSILNSNGATVFQQEKLNNQTTAQAVQVPTLTTGIYYVKVYANNKVYVQSIFVTNN
jgi:Subtilase family/GEVED domain/Secretion system C-terminal sorting domain